MSPWKKAVYEGMDVIFVMPRAMVRMTLNFVLALHHMAAKYIAKYLFNFIFVNIESMIVVFKGWCRFFALLFILPEETSLIDRIAFEPKH